MACKNCENLRLALGQALKERDEANIRALEANEQLLRANKERSDALSDADGKSRLLYILTGERR